MDETDQLREGFRRAFDEEQAATEVLRVALVRAFESRMNSLEAERKLHRATGKYTDKQLRELDDQHTYLMQQQSRSYQTTRRLLEAGKIKRLMGFG